MRATAVNVCVCCENARSHRREMTTMTTVQTTRLYYDTALRCVRLCVCVYESFVYTTPYIHRTGIRLARVCICVSTMSLTVYAYNMHVSLSLILYVSVCVVCLLCMLAECLLAPKESFSLQFISYRGR